MRVMSYNLRCWDDENGNRVSERTPRVMGILRDFAPDLIGFQEMTPKWEERLSPLEESYGKVIMYRSNESLEATPIYYKKDVFELTFSHSFWLSETPDVPSKGWGARYHRVCSIARLLHKESGQHITYINTHFDFNPTFQRKSAELLCGMRDVIENDPIICTADFNFTPESEAHSIMKSVYKDFREVADPGNMQGTMNNYSPDPEKHRLIDFLFYNGEALSPSAYKVITRTYLGKFPSDHFPICCDFSLTTPTDN